MTKQNQKVAGAEPAAGDGLTDVKLTDRFELNGFVYLPGHTNRVDQSVLKAMKAAGVVDGVQVS